MQLLLLAALQQPQVLYSKVCTSKAVVKSKVLCIYVLLLYYYKGLLAYVSIRQHTSAYVAYVSSNARGLDAEATVKKAEEKKRKEKKRLLPESGSLTAKRAPSSSELYADVCGRMRTYAGVCWRMMLTYAEAGDGETEGLGGYVDCCL